MSTTVSQISESIFGNGSVADSDSAAIAAVEHRHFWGRLQHDVSLDSRLSLVWWHCCQAPTALPAITALLPSQYAASLATYLRRAAPCFVGLVALVSLKLSDSRGAPSYNTGTFESEFELKGR